MKLGSYCVLENPLPSSPVLAEYGNGLDLWDDLLFSDKSGHWMEISVVSGFGTLTYIINEIQEWDWARRKRLVFHLGNQSRNVPWNMGVQMMIPENVQQQVEAEVQTQEIILNFTCMCFCFWRIQQTSLVFNLWFFWFCFLWVFLGGWSKEKMMLLICNVEILFRCLLFEWSHLAFNLFLKDLAASVGIHF